MVSKPMNYPSVKPVYYLLRYYGTCTQFNLVLYTSSSSAVKDVINMGVSIQYKLEEVAYVDSLRGSILLAVAEGGDNWYAYKPF